MSGPPGQQPGGGASGPGTQLTAECEKLAAECEKLAEACSEASAAALGPWCWPRAQSPRLGATPSGGQEQSQATLPAPAQEEQVMTAAWEPNFRCFSLARTAVTSRGWLHFRPEVEAEEIAGASAGVTRVEDLWLCRWPTRGRKMKNFALFRTQHRWPRSAGSAVSQQLSQHSSLSK